MAATVIVLLCRLSKPFMKFSGSKDTLLCTDVNRTINYQKESKDVAVICVLN